MTAFATRFGPRLARLAAPADTDLLARFVATRDDAAFAELVRRHGPAVLAACRRITTRTHDAEDAFQATFLVLARKAHRVRPGPPLGAWLYGVAVRAARKAASRARRVRARETPVALVPDVPERAAERPDADAARVVMEEVEQLSPRYRVAVELCELEGRPRAAAARELGIAEGTLSSRLAAARKQLAERLRARGFGPAALVVLAPAAVPRGLLAATAALTTGGPIPPRVAALTHGVVRAMLIPTFRLAAPVLGVAAVAVLAADLSGGPPVPAAPPVRVAVAQPPAPKAAPRPLAKGPNQILIYKSGHLVLVNPDGTGEKRVIEARAGFTPSTSTRLSPDGKRVALLVPVPAEKDAPPDEVPREKLFLHTIGGPWPGTDTGLECHTAEWSPDGSRLAACVFDNVGEKAPRVKRHCLVDARTGAQTTLRLPSNHVITGWTVGGDRLTTCSLTDTDTALQARFQLMNLDGTEHKRLTGRGPIHTLVIPELSPDGKRALWWNVPPTGRAEPFLPLRDLFVLDLATGERTPVEGVPPNADIQGYCWSPDGTKIAYVWRQHHEARVGDLDNWETESHLVVADSDGRNSRTILTEKGRGQWAVTLGHPDWR